MALNDSMIKFFEDGLRERILKNFDPFDQSRTVEFTPLIELKSIYGTSVLRDVISLTGAAAIDTTGPEIVLNANGGTARVDSAERGRYQAGTIGTAGVGVRLVTPPSVAGDYAEWGYFNDTNGFGFGVDVDGMYVWLQRGGVVTSKVYQEQWNGDRLSGEFDLEDGNVFQTPFLWYGYGSVRFDVVERGVQSDRKTTIHSLSTRGTVSVNDPNMPVAARCAGNCSLAVGGRQYGVFGKFLPTRRIIGDTRLDQTVGNTFVPLVSFRSKASYESVSVKLQGLSIITTNDLVLSLRVSPTLTGAVFADPAAVTETATEYDTSATALTGGEEVFVDFAVGGGGNKVSITSRDLPQIDIPQGATVTLAAKTTGSNITATVNTVLRDRQEW